jgi:hypothetical protein
MYRFAVQNKWIHSRICNITHNKIQVRDRHSGFDNKVFSILVKEVENTAVG